MRRRRSTLSGPNERRALTDPNVRATLAVILARVPVTVPVTPDCTDAACAVVDGEDLEATVVALRKHNAR